ncbi:peptidase A4 family-domain-containing protein [Coniochaeta sp. 2T2.1]|nr:peptidase A4 family-domain-containing protein [Coniochaeta sp. 2T2.1]
MKFTAILSAAILATTALAVPHPAVRKSSHHRRTLVARNEESDDWAGGVTQAGEGETYNAVWGTFKIPDVGDDEDAAGAVTIWVGVDGWSNQDPLVQAGVDIVRDDDGDVQYKAWTEWTPAAPSYIDEGDFAFTAGDTIKVEVRVEPGSTSGQAIFTNGDESHTADFSGSAGARGHEVEWIVERIRGVDDTPDTGNLLNFGTIDIMDTSIAPGIAVDMRNAEGGLGATSALNGNKVTVTWQSG